VSESESKRLFSVDEANELVPELTDIFEALRTEQRLIEAVLPDIREAAANASLGGGSPHGQRYINGLDRIAELVGRMEDMGIIVKDIQAGLCDFLHDNEGQLVLLCWRYGEPKVSWWHALEDGFQGRRNVDELALDR
jgi:hypothetical protein